MWILAVFVVLLAACPARAQESTPLAITIDDLPYTGGVARGDTRLAAIERMLEASRGVPITGFVTCRNIARGERDLARWSAGGVELGNHSSAHRAIDDLGLASFRRDVAGCQARLTKALGRPPRYFRYPFLSTGRERALRDAGFDALRELDLVRAPVSIDTSEWALVAPYVAALDAGDDERARAIADAYVDHVRRAARRYRELARERGHEGAPQILLLHANALAADRLGALIAMLRADGFRFVSLDEALRDPLYAREDRYVGSVGLSWLYRIEDGAERGWTWDAAQHHAMVVRFAGARERERFDLDQELSIRRVAERAWIVTHTVPFDANSLVVRMDDRTLVLVHTPQDEAHTRRLVDYLRARFGPAPIVAIAAHFHNDAVGGARVLLEEGARWIGSDHTARLMRERNARLGAGLREMLRDRPSVAARYEGYDPPPPREVFREREGLTLRFGADEVRVVFPGPAHAPDNVVVFFPSRRILFGGCAVVGMPRMGYVGDADLAAWPRAIEVMRALDPLIVVPGHGDRSDPGLLDHTLSLLR